MIFDRIDNAGRYRGLSENFQKAFDFLSGLDLSGLPDGKLNIDGEEVTGSVSSPPLRNPEDALFEAHRRYADIQLILEGSEKMLVTDVSPLIPDAPFQEESDIGFYRDGARAVTLSFAPGDFAVFFPEDAHKPCCRDRDPFSRKLVIKVRVD